MKPTCTGSGNSLSHASRPPEESSRHPAEIDTTFTDEFYGEMERIRKLPLAERERALAIRREKIRLADADADQRRYQAQQKALEANAEGLEAHQRHSNLGSDGDGHP